MVAPARGGARRLCVSIGNGQKLKCLTVVDEWTHEALHIDVAGSIRSGRLIEVLSQLISVRGAPRFIRSDNGPEFVSLAVLGWLTRAGVDTAFMLRGYFDLRDNVGVVGGFAGVCARFDSGKFVAVEDLIADPSFFMGTALDHTMHQHLKLSSVVVVEAFVRL